MENFNFQAPSSKYPPNDNSQLQSFRGFCDSFNCRRTEQARSTAEGAFYHTYALNPTVSRAVPHPTLIVPMNGEYKTYRSNVQYQYPKVYLSQNQYTYNTYSWGSSQFVQPYPVYGMPYRVVGDSCRHQCQPVYPQDMHRAPDPIQVQNEERESFPQANDEEIERRRKRNRDASKKSRNKRKQIISDLSRQVQDLETRNKQCEEIKGELKERNFKLENWNKILTNELDGLHEKVGQIYRYCHANNFKLPNF